MDRDCLLGTKLYGFFPYMDGSKVVIGTMYTHADRTE